MSKNNEKVTFEHLIEKVSKAESALEDHERRQGDARRQLRAAWRVAWTPGRIVAAGLVSGFLAGRAEPMGQLGKVGGARWLQMISALAGLFSTVTAATAAAAAGDAEDAAKAGPAEAAAAAADARVASANAASAATGPSGRVRSTRPHTGEWQTEPRPAEAATEISER